MAANSSQPPLQQGVVSLCVFELLLAESVAARVELAERSQADEASTLASLERLGYEVGYRFVERVAAGRALADDHLEAVKFLCKELWNEVFGKQIDKLQTNHRGVFVLKDYAFRWLARVSSSDEALVQTTANRLVVLEISRTNFSPRRLLHFPAGVLRGALANLGIQASVIAEFATIPACSFNIRIAQPPPPPPPAAVAAAGPLLAATTIPPPPPPTTNSLPQQPPPSSGGDAAP